jgi:hypothetical protein
MSNHNRIRIGLAANALFEQIMTTKTQPSSFTTVYAPLGAGIFRGSNYSLFEHAPFIAFDNIHGDCWVECFPTMNAALNWLKNDTEGAEQTEPKQAVVEEALLDDDTIEPFGIVDDSIVILLAAAGTVLLVSAVLYSIGA